jgi:phosphoadenosine phosphosulfate reductase
MEAATATNLDLPVAERYDFDPEAAAAELEGMSAPEILEWTIETFHPRLYFACSFQKTSSVIIDIAQKVEPSTRFFYLDTDVLFPETYETKDRLAEHYGMEFERYHNLTLEEQAKLHGDELWGRDPDACCNIRKVEPMRDALSSVDCWVSGIRRQDRSNGNTIKKFGWDKRFNLWKINPLADWHEKDVWNYIVDHEVPYNPLHDHGYPSIGCTHCTRPPGAGEAPRAGRWADAEKTECGLH